LGGFMSPRFFVAFALLVMAYNSEAAEMRRRSFQTSDGVKLSFLEAGQERTGKKNLVIALIAGWCMPAAIWRNQIDVFSRRYHTLAFDPRGQGESEVARYGYTAERRASDLKEFLDPHSNILLIGWSLGAIESLHYVHMFGSDRLAGLILVDSSVGEEPAPKSGGDFKQRLRNDRDGALREFVRAIFAKPRKDGELADLLQAAKRMALEDSLALLDYPFDRAHWRNVARNFKKPLLYAVTRRFEAQAVNLKKSRPATQVEVFKNAGHALFADEPERFNDLIQRFAKNLSR
jgi:microsomal epoxide hydrolase